MSVSNRVLLMWAAGVVLVTAAIIPCVSQRREGGFRTNSLHVSGGAPTGSGIPITISVGSRLPAILGQRLKMTLTPTSEYVNGMWSAVSNPKLISKTQALTIGQTSLSSAITVPAPTNNTQYQLQITDPGNRTGPRSTFTVPVDAGALGVAAVSFGMCTVAPGGTLTGSVSMPSPAQTTDTVFTLISSNPTVFSVPSTVTVPAGQLSASVTGTAGSSTGTATVTAASTTPAYSAQVTVTVASGPPGP